HSFERIRALEVQFARHKRRNDLQINFGALLAHLLNDGRAVLLEVVVEREDELLGELVSAPERSSLRVAAFTRHPRFPELFRLVPFMISLNRLASLRLVVLFKHSLSNS